VGVPGGRRGRVVNGSWKTL